MKPLTYFQLFLKFLRFGFLAWGGPVAQIALMHEELVEREKWLTEEHFKKVLGIYQALPGPEATELAVYFGYYKKGRLGGLLSGLGFVLPGFFLVLIISYFYVNYGFQLSLAQAFLYGVKPAVIALIAVAVYKIASRSITNKKLLLTAVLVAATNFLVPINIVILIFLGAIFYYALSKLNQKHFSLAALIAMPESGKLVDIFFFFLKAGLLTFGGAYTVIPFVREGAISQFGWLTPEQFLDGIALSAIVPGPLIIVSTFVGYIASGPIGAIVATTAIFFPAFAFTLIGFSTIQKIINNQKLQTFLDGLTAAVIAVIVISSISLAQAAVFDIFTLLIFAASMTALWKKKSIALIIIASGVLGIVIKLFL